MRTFFESIKKAGHLFSPEKLFVRAITAWTIACIVVAANSSIIMTDKKFLTNESVALTAVLTAVCFVALNLASYVLNRFGLRRIEYESLLLLFCALIYFSYCLLLDSDVWLTLSLCALISLCCVYAYDKNKSILPSRDVGKKGSVCVVTVFAVSVFGIIALIGVFRCLTFSAPNYDLGIFTNTAYNLKTKFIQYNTCERDKLITHFQVHISPVLYLVTPFYYLFPSEKTLQVIQAVVVSSSVIPVYLICKSRKFSNKLTVVLCFVSVFFPALSTGTFYDFHENAFLPAFILWMIYFYEKKKTVPMFIFAMLTLSVKEDASVYVAFFGLYLLTQKGDRVKGLVLSAISVFYVLCCVWFINKYGFGAMTGRFKDYITDERLGLIGIAATVFLDPIYAIKNCMSSEKLEFVFQMTAPLMFLPFVTKKYTRFILLCPMILMNLMPSYQYQHSIYFQYIFGTAPLLLYLALINAGELSQNVKRKTLCCCVCVTTLCFCAFVLPKTYYISKYYSSPEKYQCITEVLEAVPDDASVSASAFYVPYLANRDVIYETEYTDKTTEYIVYDLRYDHDKKKETKLDRSEYEEVVRHENLVAVYRLRSEG